MVTFWYNMKKHFLAVRALSELATTSPPNSIPRRKPKWDRCRALGGRNRKFARAPKKSNFLHSFCRRILYRFCLNFFYILIIEQGRSWCIALPKIFHSRKVLFSIQEKCHFLISTLSIFRNFPGRKFFFQNLEKQMHHAIEIVHFLTRVERLY